MSEPALTSEPTELSEAIERLRADEYAFISQHDYCRPIGLIELRDLRLAAAELLRIKGKGVR